MAMRIPMNPLPAPSSPMGRKIAPMAGPGLAPPARPAVQPFGAVASQAAGQKLAARAAPVYAQAAAQRGAAVGSPVSRTASRLGAQAMQHRAAIAGPSQNAQLAQQVASSMLGGRFKPRAPVAPPMVGIDNERYSNRPALGVFKSRY